MALIEWKSKFLHGDVKTPRASGYFGTKRHQEETRIKMFIRENHTTIEHDAEHWCNVFSWKNEFGVRETPRLEVVEEALKLAGKNDPEFEAYKKDLESVSCGKRYPGMRQPKAEKDARVTTPAQTSPPPHMDAELDEPEPHTDAEDELPARMEGATTGDEFQMEGDHDGDNDRKMEDQPGEVPKTKKRKTKRSTVKSPYKGGKSTYENWTHKDYAAFFDPNTDEIPSNQR